MLYWIFIAFLLHVSIVKGTDPCTSYMELDEYRRSTGYVRDSAPICDATITEGWYRSVSKAGGDMPISGVPYQRCGTTFPLWINDTLPTDNATENVKVCVAHFNSPCFYDFTINVKNCGSYNVYYLNRTRGCAQAYCFGNEFPCPDGKSSENGFSPGCSVYPDISFTLLATSSLTDGKFNSPTIIHKVIMFECQINSTINSTEAYLFDVVWYIESTQILSFGRISYGNLSQTILTEESWAGTYKLGFNVKCGMRVRFGYNGSPTPYQYSPYLYAGFKADKAELILKKTESVLVNIILTVPFGCASLRSDIHCQLKIRLRQLRYQEQCQNEVKVDNVVFVNGVASITFDHSKWSKAQTLNVTGKSTNNYNSNDRVTYIKLQADQNLVHGVWSYATIPDIKVYVAAEEVITLNKLCRSHGEYPMTTFDGRKWENQRAGEFVLYQHKSYPIWVQVMYTACSGLWGLATCSCGIAVRYSAAIFEANFCGSNSTHYVRGQPKSQYIERNFCDDKYMKVVRNGDAYTITLPTSTQVMFQHGDVNGTHGIHHIQIKPSVLDIKSSSGLCGYFDGINSSSFEYQLRNGAFTTEASVFANEWRIDPSKGDISLFGRTDLAQYCVPMRQYCVSGGNLEESKVDCNLDREIATCIHSKRTLTNLFFTTCGRGSGQSESENTCTTTTAEATSTTLTTTAIQLTTTKEKETSSALISVPSTPYKG